MRIYRHYRSEYGDWYLTWEGEGAEHVQLPDPRKYGSEVYPKSIYPSQYRPVSMGDFEWPHDFKFSERITTPEYESGRFWIENGEWRQTPHREWEWDRQGVHAIKGAVLGAANLIALTGVPLWAILAVVAICLHTFLRYEETEEVELDDRAYRDIGGWLVGYLPAALGSLVVLGLLT